MLAIIFLAAGLPEFRLLPAQPFPYALFFDNASFSSPNTPLPGLPASALELAVLLGILFLALVLVLWIITFIIRPKARKRMLTRIITYFILLLLMSGLLNVMRQLAPNLVNAPDRSTAGSLPETPFSVEDIPTPPTFILQPPVWLAPLITLILVSLLLGTFWFLWQRRTINPLIPDQGGPLKNLVQEVQLAVEQIQRGSDVRDTVLSCYQAMNQVLKEQQGIQRQKAMTARDFEHHLVEFGLGDDHIRRLTRLFEKVRYGAKPTSSQEESEAIACLTAIVEAYGRAI